jgi:phosphoribosyl 1,2-cyclic phosphate phosphodiesterase
MPTIFTILGCGSSAGVPRVAQGWGACDPNNPKNRRRRTSLLVERIEGGRKTTVLIDTTPDLREQLLEASVTKIDGVLYTHAHADHTHGIDDLRPLFLHHRRRVDVYMDDITAREVRAKFGYCFESPPGSDYPPIVTAHRIEAGKPVTIEGEGGPITVLPVLQHHGDIHTLGFRFGGFAYCVDVKSFPETSVKALSGLDIWVTDALRYREHPSHFSVEEALSWIKRVNPRRTVLTNLHTDLDYATLAGELPENVEPAFDGLKIELNQ